MIILILGLILWSGVHLLPALAATERKKLMLATGVIPYKIIFATLIVASVVLMVRGWQSVVPVEFYAFPAWTRYITLFLVLLTCIFFVAARVKTNIKRVIRHPQLSGLVLWCVGHLLVNGDSRSLVLFGGLMLWAILEIILINHRDGLWVKADSVSAKKDLLVLVAGIFLFSLLLFLHPYIAGVALM